MNKAELVTKMIEESGLSKKDTEKALEAFTTTVFNALEIGEKVKIVGFGSFETRDTKERAGVNPQNPTEKIIIPAGKKVYFKPSKSLKELINK